MSALLSFLGGSVFRMIWGEVASFITRWQEHHYEIARLELQIKIDDHASDRQAKNLEVQGKLGIQTLVAQHESEMAQADNQTFKEAIVSVFKPIVNPLLDFWNGAIRPLAATIVIVLWCCKLFAQGFIMDDYDRELSGVVLGFFFANRVLGSRGK